MSENGPAQSIALDGPAAAGKSTVGRGVAEGLGYLYFDTGSLYRALTWLGLRAGVAPTDEGPLAALADAVALDVVSAPDTPVGYRVFADGADVTASLRGSEVEAAVPQVSRHPKVRQVLLDKQRRVAAGGPVVMVGRDIGTVVLPDADLKIYLDASQEERARRRFREQLRRGEASTFSGVLAEVRQRDETDSARAAAPLRRAANAVVVITDGCTPQEVVAHLIALVRRWPDVLTTAGGESPCTAAATPTPAA